MDKLCFHCFFQEIINNVLTQHLHTHKPAWFKKTSPLHKNSELRLRRSSLLLLLVFLLNQNGWVRSKLASLLEERDLFFFGRCAGAVDDEFGDEIRQRDPGLQNKTKRHMQSAPSPLPDTESPRHYKKLTTFIMIPAVSPKINSPFSTRLFGGNAGSLSPSVQSTPSPKTTLKSQ